MVLSFLLRLVSVGKTSLITRFMYDSFDNTYQVSTEYTPVSHLIWLFHYFQVVNSYQFLVNNNNYHHYRLLLLPSQSQRRRADSTLYSVNVAWKYLHLSAIANIDLNTSDCTWMFPHPRWNYCNFRTLWWHCASNRQRYEALIRICSWQGIGTRLSGPKIAIWTYKCRCLSFSCTHYFILPHILWHISNLRSNDDDNNNNHTAAWISIVVDIKQ